MENLLLHPQTQQQIDNYLTAPSHALLITGLAGAGKGFVAHWLLATVLETGKVATLDTYPYFRCIIPVKNSIGIESIRSLNDFVRLKSIGKGTVRRAILIEDAHTMTIEAQNAFLKLLEEPPADTVIILTATRPQLMLPTIISRSQHLPLKTPHKEYIMHYFLEQKVPSMQIEKNYFMSNGQLGLLHALIHEDASHPLVASIEQAKSVLAASTFERLLKIDSLSKNKDELSNLLFALQTVGHAAMTQAASKNNKVDVQRWHTILTRINTALQQLASNAQAKLLLTDLFLNL